MVLCHTNKNYLKKLQAFKRAIKQRNNLLHTLQPNNESLQAWNTKLSFLGEELWITRGDFFNQFNEIFKELWEQLEINASAKVIYKPGEQITQKEY